ncbi:MAG: PAS domain S-box protein [Microcoleus sp. SU_5_3]|nr:PAS domain S-box protein [Microcoleus sp. SU_5_3]
MSLEFQSVGREIMKSKQLEQSDRQLLNLLGRAVKDSAVYLLDVSGCVVTWNVGAQNIYGFQEPEIVGQHFSCLFPRELVELGQPSNQLQQAQHLEFYEVESKRIRADGSEFWANAAIAPLHDSTGQLSGFAEVVRDLTERQRTAQVLTEIQAKYKTVLQICPAGILITDEVGNIQETNAVAEVILGISNHPINPSLSNILDWKMLTDRGDYIPASENSIAPVFAENATVENREVRIVNAKGETIWTRLTAAPIPLECGGAAIAIADIGSCKNNESTIYNLEQELRILLENTPDIIAKFDKDLRQVYTNSVIKTAPNLLPKTVFDSAQEKWEMPAETEAIWHQAIQTAFTTGTQQVTQLDWQTQGGLKSYQACLLPQFAKDDSVASVLTIARDVTDRQRAESVQQQQKEFLQTIFDYMPVMLAFYNAVGELQSVNREWERVLGWSSSEAIEIDLLAECYPEPAYRETVIETISRSDGNGTTFKPRCDRVIP